MYISSFFKPIYENIKSQIERDIVNNISKTFEPKYTFAEKVGCALRISDKNELRSKKVSDEIYREVQDMYRATVDGFQRQINSILSENNININFGNEMEDDEIFVVNEKDYEKARDTVVNAFIQICNVFGSYAPEDLKDNAKHTFTYMFSEEGQKMKIR